MLAVVASLLALASPPNLAPYSPTKVELAGEVVLLHYRDPGSNLVDAPALRLQQPISLKGGSGEFNGDSFSGIKLVQLVGLKWKSLCGRTVRLVGTLDEPDTGNFDSPVVMTVDRVSARTERKRCLRLDDTKR